LYRLQILRALKTHNLHSEPDALKALVEEHMVNAIPLKVPVVVSMDVGENWLEAH